MVPAGYPQLTDIDDVRQGIGFDQRIGFSFLFPGVGYGGSCFPKDIRAVIHMAQSRGVSSRMMEAVDEVNEAQKEVLHAGRGERITRFT